MKKKCHEICFRNVPNDWDSALPTGSGKMGAMVFLEGHVLHIALNQYDCYYHVLGHLYEEKKESGETFRDPARFGETYEALCRRIDDFREKGDTSRNHYTRMLHPKTGEGRPSYRGASYPVGGELLLTLDEAVDTGISCLRLRIEEAEITFEAGEEEARVTASLIAAAGRDGVLMELSQSRSGLWKKAEFAVPSMTGQGAFQKELRKVSEDKSGGIAMRLTFGDLCQEAAFLTEEGAADFSGTAREFAVAVSLRPGENRGIEEAAALLREKEAVGKSHRAHWEKFWRSGVELPDKFLERLWYLHLYMMECSCGKGSGYPEQSWGLSGLWDIRRPNMWGSMWYWDVNIQSSFWGSYSAGHPEILKLFCDGYLAYREDIYAYTEKVYGKKGWALDYPHTLYNCIQPWCAQFLWKYYEYTGNTEFLEKEAYPVFREQIAFFKELAVRDKDGIYHVEYDISPEQGPVTRDSVITVSCVKKLLSMAIRAAGILRRPKEEIREMQELLRHLPEYQKTADGTRYKDSALAQDEVFLRHPSVLMPLFPAGEAGIGGASDPAETHLWEQTLKFAAEHTETGTFGMGWLAAAAAALGYGKTALRLLYEKGLDHVLHTNGLAYEESERFLNYCHVTKPAHFLPAMMESSGGIVNAVNKMLLQTGADGILRIFPAMPGEADLLEKQVQYLEDEAFLEGKYQAWENAGFYGLMAPGGFLVSAERRNGKTVFVKIKSTREAALRLLVPEELAENGTAYLKECEMKAGESLCLGRETGICGDTESRKEAEEEVLVHEAAGTRRRIFLGADRHTAYCQAVDRFTCAFLFGNEFQYKRTPYVFDFGVCEGEKHYDSAYPPQFVLSGQSLLYTGGPKRVGLPEYDARLGYGFESAEYLAAFDRKKPDALRRDFVEGTEEAVFVLELPKGKYDVLLISGDEEEESSSVFDFPDYGSFARTGRQKPGSYACKVLSVFLEKDGKLKIRIRAEEGAKWKLNAMFINIS